MIDSERLLYDLVDDLRFEIDDLCRINSHLRDENEQLRIEIQILKDTIYDLQAQLDD